MTFECNINVLILSLSIILYILYYSLVVLYIFFFPGKCGYIDVEPIQYKIENGKYKSIVSFFVIMPNNNDFFVCLFVLIFD